MKNMLAPIFVLASLLLATLPVQAESLVSGSIDAGKAKALTCTACHGPEGKGSWAPVLNNEGFLASATDGFLQATIVTSSSTILDEALPSDQH